MCWVCVLRTSLRPEQLSIPRSLQLFRRNGSFRGQHKLKRGVIVAAMSYRHEANPVMMEHVRVCGHTVVLPHELSVTLTLVWVCVCLSVCLSACPSVRVGLPLSSPQFYRRGVRSSMRLGVEELTRPQIYSLLCHLQSTGRFNMLRDDAVTPEAVEFFRAITGGRPRELRDAAMLVA